jgi:nitrogenase subunit NifH
MIVEFILTGIIVALVIERVLYTNSVHKQFNELTRAVIAKSATDLAQSKAIEEVTSLADEENSDVVLAESMSDEEFDEMVKKQAE